MKDGGCFVGVDVGGTKTLLIARERGEMLLECVWPTEKNIPDFRAHLEQVFFDLTANGHVIAGMAMGVAGRVTPESGVVVDAPALGWVRQDLKKTLFSGWGFPCRVENDTTMAMLAEMHGGRAKGCTDAVLITLGTGVGCAILSGGRLLSGATNSAGEIGYCVFEPPEAGFSAAEGRFGFLESRISGTALQKMAEPLGYTAKTLFDHADDAAARQIIDRFLGRLTVTVANMMSLLNPQVVVLGGGVAASLGDYRDAIERAAGRLTPVRARVELSEYDNRAGALGACCLAESGWQSMI